MRVRRLLSAAAGAALAVAWLAQPASAAPTCTFDAATGIVTVTLGPGESATVSRSTDAIALDDTACDTATVTTTETIAVTGTGSGNSLTIDLSGGAFGPGKTVEPDAAGSEIEFTVDLGSSGTLHVLGGTTADGVTFGASGINLNASETTADADVTLTGSPTLDADAAGGDDTLSAGGGAGTGAAVGNVSLKGGDGNDVLGGGTGGDVLDGGPGTDTADFTAASQIDLPDLAAGVVSIGTATTDTLAAIENVTGSAGNDHIVGDGSANVLKGGGGDDTLEGGGGDDTLDGDAGNDTADYSDAAAGVAVDLSTGKAGDADADAPAGAGADTLIEVENVGGSAFGDDLVGDANANALSGDDGDDVVDGGDGDDALDGGEGNDTASFKSAQEGVTVSLTDGTASGAGTDTLVGFENVTGSGSADDITGDGEENTLLGRNGADVIHAQGGQDVLKGSKGADDLFGGDGRDRLRGGDGKDQLYGGDGHDVCNGGPDADSWSSCED